MSTVGEKVLKYRYNISLQAHKKTRTQYTTNNTRGKQEGLSSPNTMYNIQYGLSNSQGQGSGTYYRRL
jgi:hypothetical protein